MPASSTTTASALWWSCAGIVALGAVEAVSGAFRHVFAIRNRARADAEVRDAIFRRALELDSHYHDRVGAGDLISRASNDAELVARAFDSIGHTIGYVLTIVGASCVLLVLDWRLALAVLLPLPLLSVGFGRYSERYAERTKINQEELATATALVEESIAGVRVVKGLGAEAALSARFKRRSDDVVRTALDVANVDAVFLPALEALPLIGDARRALVRRPPGARRRHHDRHLRGVRLLPRAAREPAAHDRAARRDRAARGRRAGARRRRAARRAGRRRGVEAAHVPRRRGRPLRLGSLRLRRRERPVLDGFDLSIPAGTSLALVGATGSGKSTAAALLARFYDPDAGRVTIGGVDVRELRLERAPARRRDRVRETHSSSATRCAATSGSRAPDAPDEDDRARDPARRRRGVRRAAAGGLRDDARRARLSRSRAGSASGSRSRARSSPIRRC